MPRRVAMVFAPCASSKIRATDSPPPVPMNSDAATLLPGAGKFSTRMTMSCTTMPEHRILGLCFAGARSVKADLVVHPSPDDVMRDRDRKRRGQAIGVLAQ